MYFIASLLFGLSYSRRTGDAQMDMPIPDFVILTVPMPGGEPLRVLQPAEAADLPDDGPVEWAPLLPYWSVLWRSGVALARSLAGESLYGRRVVELGCGLALPSLVAARAGARVLATDGDPDAIAVVERNARENGIRLKAARAEWDEPGSLAAEGPFDLVLAADVLYERESVALLLDLLPRLGASEVLLADPGRPAAEEFLERAAEAWTVEADEWDAVKRYRLTRRAPVRR
jgi:predicted nicotinamide N-methyase